MNIFRNLKKINLGRSLNVLNIERKVVIFLAIIVFGIVNLLIAGFALRQDFSYGKAYTLSPATKKIVRDLNDIVTIKFFVSSDLPARLSPIKSEVNDLLNEYKRTNARHITLKIVDPKKDDKAAQDARESGIPELQFSQVEQDKYAITTAQFGIALFYSDKTEVLPQVTDIESLEYNLTAAIYKMTRTELPKIGILGSNQINPQSGDGLVTIKTLLQKQFIVENVDVSSASVTREIDSSYKAIIVTDSNSKQYDSDEIKAIESYIAKKGKALFFVDGVWVRDNLQTAVPTHNLGALLETYGIKINKDLLLSAMAERVNFGNGAVAFSLPYPLWIRTNVFNPKTAYFSNVGSLTFPWASSITLLKKQGMEQDELIKTTERSWNQTGPFSLDPQNVPQPSAGDIKQFIIGAQSRQNNGGKLIVIPSSRFIQDRYLSPNAGNVALVLNILNDMASEGALSGINQRAIKFYEVPNLPENQKDFFKYGNILLLPALLGVLGAIRLMKRK